MGRRQFNWRKQIEPKPRIQFDYFGSLKLIFLALPYRLRSRRKDLELARLAHNMRHTNTPHRSQNRMIQRFVADLTATARATAALIPPSS